jgi:hypothetical protein
MVVAGIVVFNILELIMEIIPNYPTLVAYSLVNIVIWAYLAQAT